jgi:hypothetical protein
LRIALSVAEAVPVSKNARFSAIFGIIAGGCANMPLAKEWEISP